MTPTVQLPFGEGRRFFNESRIANAILGNWTISAVIQMQSGFPIGVSQNTNNTNLLGSDQRPNIVPGQEFLCWATSPTGCAPIRPTIGT